MHYYHHARSSKWCALCRAHCAVQFFALCGMLWGFALWVALCIVQQFDIFAQYQTFNSLFSVSIIKIIHALSFNVTLYDLIWPTFFGSMLSLLRLLQLQRQRFRQQWSPSRLLGSLHWNHLHLTLRLQFDLGLTLDLLLLFSTIDPWNEDINDSNTLLLFHHSPMWTLFKLIK